MNPDPGTAIRRAAFQRLTDEGAGGIRINHPLGERVRWRPDLYETATERAWYILSAVPSDDFWSDLIGGARAVSPDFTVGLVAPIEVLRNRSVLEAADKLDAELMPVELRQDGYFADTVVASVGDWVIERRLRLDPEFAKSLLERTWQSAKVETDSHVKGRLLERLGRLLLSQVDGWVVHGKAMRRRNQEIDIIAQNERIGGLLGRGQLILGEAKNRDEKVDTDQYTSFRNKLHRSSGMAKLGFMISRSGFTEGARLEAVSHSREDDLIVLLNEDALTHLWRVHESVNAGVEAVVLQAVQDQRQIRVPPDW